MISYFDNALSIVDRGKAGLNAGLPFGIYHLDNLINGVQPSQYTLVGGETSTGKTAFVDTVYVINPLNYLFMFQSNAEQLSNQGYKFHENVDYLIYYYSFEINVAKKIIKWTSYYLWARYGIIVDYNYIVSKGQHRISDDIYSKFIEARNYTESMLEHIHFIDIPKNPTGIKADILKRLNLEGKIKKHTRKIKGQHVETEEYIPNNPNLIFNVIIDHVGLMSIESDTAGGNRLSKKQNLDRMSQYAIELRNKYNVSFTFLSQFNREIADINRRRFAQIQPQLNDFKDTGNMSEDAEIVMGLFNPMKYNEKQYLNYQISGQTGIGRRSRFAFILKNRDGIDNVNFGLNFLGEAGYFRDLPNTESYLNNAVYKHIMDFTYERPEQFRISS